MSTDAENGVVEVENATHKRSPQEKAFSNSVICTEIAKALYSMKDLNSFRLTSTSCNDNSLSIWKKRASVEVRHTSKELFSKLSKVDLFQNYNLFLYYPFPDNGNVVKYWENNHELPFWKECGPHIKQLSINESTFSQRGLVNHVCKWTPNLQSLTINGVCYTADEHERSGELKIHSKLKVLRVPKHTFVSNLNFLESFPNLLELKLSEETDKDLFPTLHRLREKHKSILNLKILDLINMDHPLEGLAELRLSLEHLSLRLKKDANTNMLLNVLSLQCSTLKSLKLLRVPLSDFEILCPSSLYVNFSSLTELHLYGKMVSSFTFLKWMPALKTLVVDLLCYDRLIERNDRDIWNTAVDPYYVDMVSSSGIVMETDNFQHLYLEYFEMDYEFSVQSLEILGKWMPNLKVLKTILCNETLRLVCQQWKNLKELKLVFGSHVTDSGITGLVANMLFSDQDRLPNLTNLKKLVSFGLECYCEMSTITDLSAHYAFLQMPHLETLKICSSPELTESVEALLKKNIQNVEIIRNYGSLHFQYYVRCCTLVCFYQKNNDAKTRINENAR